MVPQVTLLELVRAVGEVAATEDEVLAAIVDMVNGGKVQLIGTFRGCRIVIDEVSAAA